MTAQVWECPHEQEHQKEGAPVVQFCIDHNLWLMDRAIDTAGTMDLGWVINDLIHHRWMRPALYTWCTLAARMMLPPEMSRRDGADALIGTVYDGEGEPCGELDPDTHGWAANLPIAMVRAAMLRSSGELTRLFDRWSRASAVDRVNVVSSLVATISTAVEKLPEQSLRARTREGHLVHMYGMHVRTPEQYATLDDLVDASVAVLDSDEVGMRAALLPLHSAVRPGLAGVLVATTTLTSTIREYKVVKAPRWRGIAPYLDGVVLEDWLDEDADGARSPEHLGAVRAMRMAHAHMRLDMDYTKACVSGPGASAFIAGVLPAAVSMVAADVAQWDAAQQRRSSN